MIKVVFSTHRKFSIPSLFFRLMEGTPYSHVSLLMPNGFYYHVTLFGKVHINTSYYFEKHNEIVDVKNVLMEPEMIGLMLSECSKMEGVDYGVMNVIGVGISRFLKLFGIRAPNFFKDNSKSFYCSEFVWYILKKGGLELKGFDPELDGPKRLNELLKWSSI